MTCPKCGSQNVQVQFVQTSAKTRTKKKGCLYGMARGCLVTFTLGFWALLGKKKSKSNTSFSNEKRAVCSNCGNAWRVR